MSQFYITNQGDTFDKISKIFYGKENLFIKIIEANPEHSSVVVFSSGIELIIPEIEVSIEEVSSTSPWR